MLPVDHTGRLFREGKTVISAELTEILDRLGTNAEIWQVRVENIKSGRLLGRFFAASRERLREAAAKLRSITSRTSRVAQRDNTLGSADSPPELGAT